MNLPTPATPEDNSIESFERELETEYEAAKQTKKEIDLMLKQSEAEMAGLTSRNVSASAELQQVQAQIETMPRSDIKFAYNRAMETQQRLYIMRGQLEKMQNDSASWARYISLLEKIIEQFSRGYKGRPGSASGSAARSAGTSSIVLENMINAQEAERESLSKRMHDGPAQALSNFIVQAEIASRFLDIDVNRAKEEMANLKNGALTTFKEVRTFIFELRPMMLDDLGLIPTINRYCESFKEQTGCDIVCSIKGGSERKLLSFQSSMVFRAVQELIGNAYRHNSDNPARIQISVNVIFDENLIKVMVSDNGKGFEQEVAFTNTKMSGLRIIRERVEMLGGHMEIDSGIGRGARVSFQVPILDADN